MVQIPDTYEQLTWKLIGTFPNGFQRVDIVADTYQAVSIKSGERQSRGTSAKVIIGSPQSKIPRDFNQFMTNGDNKTRLVEIICDVLSSNRLKTFRVLKCRTVFFSKENVTIRLNEVEVCQFAPLSSNQEEADTKSRIALPSRPYNFG